MNKASLAAAVMAAMGLSACASITGDSVQSVRIETRLADGTEVRDADCELFNEHGSFRVKSPGNVTIRRSSTDINVTCKKDALPDAQGRAVSRANAGMFGNIIFGGVVGAVIDHSKGTAYTYPQWMQLVFGKLLTFDRRDDKDGQPSLAQETGSTATAKAAAPAPMEAPVTGTMPAAVPVEASTPVSAAPPANKPL